MNNNLVLLIVAGLLLLSNLGLLTFIARLISRQAEQVDKLTSKLMARDLSDYSVVEPRVRQEIRPNQVKDSGLQAIDEANPEDVMRSLAAQSGRLDDYTLYGGMEE